MNDLIAAIGIPIAIFTVGSVVQQLFGIHNAPLYLFIAVGGFPFLANLFAKK